MGLEVPLPLPKASDAGILTMAKPGSPTQNRKRVGELYTWSKLVTWILFVCHPHISSYYNLGYLVLDDKFKILIAFGISTAILVICGCYSTVIGGFLKAKDKDKY